MWKWRCEWQKDKSQDILYEPIEIRHELWSDDNDDDDECVAEHKSKIQKLSGEIEHITNLSVSNDGLFEEKEDENSDKNNDEDESPLPYTDENEIIWTKKYSVWKPVSRQLYHNLSCILSLTDSLFIIFWSDSLYNDCIIGRALLSMSIYDLWNWIYFYNCLQY